MRQSTMSVPMDRNPALRPGLAALVESLMGRNYSAHAIGRIFDHAATAGTVTGSGCLEPEDEAAAEAAFVDALSAVPYDAEAWDKPDVFIDAESFLEALDRRRIPRGAVLVPPEVEPDGPTAEDLAEYGHYLEVLDREQVAAMVTPISGGAPEDGDDWPMIKDAADRRRDMADVAEWYAAHPGG